MGEKEGLWSCVSRRPSGRLVVWAVCSNWWEALVLCRTCNAWPQGGFDANVQHPTMEVIFPLPGELTDEVLPTFLDG